MLLNQLIYINYGEISIKLKFQIGINNKLTQTYNINNLLNYGYINRLYIV